MKFTYKLFPDWIQWLSAVPDHRVLSRSRYGLQQTLFCGLCLFVFRHRSLRAFTLEARGNKVAGKNFNRWILFDDVPSDDQTRQILATVSTVSMNGLLKSCHQRIERQKVLEQKSNSGKLMGKFDLLAMDATGQLSSNKIHCEKCLTRKTENEHGQVTIKYMHSQLLFSLTNMNASYALPFQFEPIERSDTETQYSKNDCELNAAKRALVKLKTNFPKRSFCILGDCLFSVESVTELIRSNGWHFIFTAKPEKNKELFFMWDYLNAQRKTRIRNGKNGVVHIYEWINELPLKQAKFKEVVPLVSLISYQEISADGEIVFASSWMTDIPVDYDNVVSIAKAGRTRFVIENRNFNEQKNIGFQTEHSFGHFGNLPNVFFGLAQIAQLITEIFRFWKPAKDWIKTIGSKRRYFEILSVLVTQILMPDDGENIIYLKFDFSSA